MNIFAEPRRVLSYGSFDGLDPNHLDTLRRLARMGDEVIIGLGTDAFLGARGQKPRRNFEERRHALMTSLYVDHIIPQNSLDQMRTDIVNYNVGLLAVSDPSHPRIEDLEDLTQVVFLTPAQGLPTTSMRPAEPRPHPETARDLLKSA